jgi:isochorismate synthase/2-succinyl-5-enolpyruvyl-6-hydroxy-3-cyclohexene-1-carboxylate synthase/2-succinyl-6-hydroxy-2,4-cyclohexadiene-1-carboxylate synthase/O-succinylbenzoate synthase
LRQIGKEISFQLDAELTLSEPHVAHIVANSLPLDSAFFLGNNMSVQNSDMYCEGGLEKTVNLPAEFNYLPRSFVRVAESCGASGLHEILNIAIGFAAGCGQRVLSLSLS